MPTAPAVDDELATLFAQEAADRLTRLTERLLQLEQTPNDPELVSSLFREAHTIKGSASVVGFHEVARVAHALEDVLEQLRRGERLADPDLIDVVLRSVDGLRELVDAALQGEERREQTAALVAVLAAAAESRSVSDPPASEAAATAAPEEGERREASTGERALAERADGAIRVPVGRIDDIVRLVGEAAAAHLRVGRRVAERTGAEGMELSEFRDLSSVLNELQEKTMRARMVPVATVTERLHRAVRDTARALGKSVKWEVRGEDTELDRSVLEQLADPMLQLVRNSVDHGIESAEGRAAAGKPEQGVVRLHAMQIGSEVIIAISDDGRGIDVQRVREEASRSRDCSALTEEEALYQVFRSGLSTADFVTDISGRGVGLDVVRSSMDAVRGRVEVHSEPGAGTEFRLAAPITLAVLPCLVVFVGEDRYAIPMHSVLLVHDRTKDIHTTSNGRPMVWIAAQPLAVSGLGEVLGLEQDCDGPVVVVSAITRTHAFRVSGLAGQRDVLVKGLGGLLPRFDVLTGASVEPDGSILLVLDAHGLIDRARRARRTIGSVEHGEEPDAPSTDAKAARLLVVDDALTVRELQRSILERAGHEVVTAASGIEALARMSEGPFDLVLTDVDMPGMDGFTLTQQIRGNPVLANTAVIILTSLSSEADKRRGLEVGADGYIVKSAFDEAALLSAVERLLGRNR